VRERREILNFLRAFLQGAEPTPELLGAFILGLIVANALAQLVYDLAMAPETLPTLWRPALIIIVLTGAAYLLYRRDRQRARTMHVYVDENRLAPPHAGIVWLFGPGRFDHLLFALEHHHKGGGASHCWLVMQNTEPAQRTYSQLLQQLPEKGLNTQLHPVYIPQLEAGDAYQAVRRVFEEEAPKVGLKPEDVIADITGGLKPLTAGMILAAITLDRALEYVESERNPQGEPIPGTLRVVLIDLNFYVTRRG
jgi:hypothetical protein